MSMKTDKYALISVSLLAMLEENTINHQEFVFASILLKQTICFDKKKDGISLSQWIKKSGMGKDTVIKYINSLIEKKIIKKTRQRDIKKGDSYSIYSFVNLEKIIRDTPCLKNRVDKQKNLKNRHTIERNNNNNNRDFFNLVKIYLKEYVNHLSRNSHIQNIDAYKTKIFNELMNLEEMTVTNFKEWLKVWKGICL